ncbi:hypothetical protein B296_00049337 [Ensete ventricosum]|uniref:Uncharacterized protein n=1 Tax=Ensete ventricosum TaxID=4639 RepID=A0A426YR25_ENSVE|nr:hypothetical protein B296_00049337 [Ensete ventricosum]
MAGGGGREERNRGGWRRKRRPREKKAKEGLATVKKGLAATEAAGKRRRQWGPARKRGRKVRRVQLDQQPRSVGASAMGSTDVTAGGEEWLATTIEEESKAVVGG